MKTLEIHPMTAPIDADIAIPGSKSITNRVLLIAALADGISHLDNALKSDDTWYMANALRDLGIRVDESDNAFSVYGTGGHIPSLPSQRAVTPRGVRPSRRSWIGRSRIRSTPSMV